MKLSCEVKKVIFLSQQNGFAVCAVSTEELGKVTITGYMPDVKDGCKLSIEGEWKVDKKFGPQIVVSSYEELFPTSKAGLEKYLSSGAIKGVGPKLAKRIVAAFGEDTIKILDENIDRLSTVRGISGKTLDKIKNAWEQTRAVRNIMLFLQGNGISPAMAARIFKRYGQDSVKKVRENPYRLAEDVWGIGFKTADKIAMAFGFPVDSPLRIDSALIYVLNTLSEQGHTYAGRDQLSDETYKLLEVDLKLILEGIDRLVENSSLINDKERLYLPSLYFAEKRSAEKLLQMNATSAVKTIPYECVVLDNDNIHYDESQKVAIQSAAKNKITVITGGPGTGKTTIMNRILKIYRDAGLSVLLAAPTGRAAKKMSESTGREAKTIHRLLEFHPDEGFRKNQADPLCADAIIIDECSMIDIKLFDSLLKAIPLRTRLILVGDKDQLPSVGPGNVLKDIIESGTFAVSTLRFIHRQDDKSRIASNAHLVNVGKMPDLANQKEGDFWFIEMEDPVKIGQTIVKLMKEKIPNTFGFSPEDIQVLTPMRKGDIGTQNLNILLQSELNSQPEELKSGFRTYRLNDRVMQMCNNYEKDVFNGDIGRICELNTEDGELMVDFDGHVVGYDMSDLDELVLSYASTVHKSQGSEYPVVIMPVSTQHHIMLQRNLLYTAITRARKMVVLIGTTKAIGIAVHNNKVTQRNSGLLERLKTKEASRFVSKEPIHGII